MCPKSLQLCPTLCDPMNYSLPGSSVHGDSPGKNIKVGCCVPIWLGINACMCVTVFTMSDLWAGFGLPALQACDPWLDKNLGNLIFLTCKERLIDLLKVLTVSWLWTYRRLAFISLSCPFCTMFTLRWSEGRASWNGERGVPLSCVILLNRLLWWLRQQRICLQCGRPGFCPWVGKISWRREWLPTPVSLPGEFQGQRILEGYSPWGHKKSPMWLST